MGAGDGGDCANGQGIAIRDLIMGKKEWVVEIEAHLEVSGGTIPICFFRPHRNSPQSCHDEMRPIIEKIYRIDVQVQKSSEVSYNRFKF